MATIKEIAELAGVSRGTVDRVLNNRGRVNKDTARKVKEIADALNYKPNKAGLILSAQKKTLKLGVILFGTNNPFFEDIIKGIKEKSKELESYNCTIKIKLVPLGKLTPYKEVRSQKSIIKIKVVPLCLDEQIKAIDDFVNDGINGIALTPYNDKKITLKINELHDIGIPVVTLNTDIEGSKRLAYVGSNYYNSGKTAAGLMNIITHGDVNIGIVSGSKNVMCHSQRILGFKDCIENNYPHIKIIEIVYNDDDDIKSYELTSQLLKNKDINALFFVAGGVYGGCRAVVSSKKKNNITSISFDSVPTTKSMIEKGLIKATICQQPELQGSKPLDILFSYLSTGELPKEENIYLSSDIRIKENI